MPHDRHHRFAALHAEGCFVLPNPWDLGTARLLAAQGASALATSSAALAFTLGRRDGTVTRDEVLAHTAALVAATPLPVSVDLEQGFADLPHEVASTVRLAAAAGASGGSIEDVHPVAGGPAYAHTTAVKRIAAAVDAARELRRPFVLTARADGLLTGDYDLEEAIGRVRAFAEVGADVVYVPGLASRRDLERVVAAVGVPVNALAGGGLSGCSVADLAASGVRRVSLGSRLARLAQTVVRDAVATILEGGELGVLDGAAEGDEFDALLALGGG